MDSQPHGCRRAKAAERVPGLGASPCTVEHVGLVVSGAATAAFENGEVIGDQQYASLHVLGADAYAIRDSAAAASMRPGA